MQYNKGMVARGTHIVQLSKTYKEPKARTDNTPANSTTASPISAANTTNTNSSTSGSSTNTEVPYKYREGAERHRVEAQSLVYGPLLTFSQTPLSASDWSKKFRMKVGSCYIGCFLNFQFKSWDNYKWEFKCFSHTFLLLLLNSRTTIAITPSLSAILCIILPNFSHYPCHILPLQFQNYFPFT